jgi:uncharacterized protein (DUF2141 family)
MVASMIAAGHPIHAANAWRSCLLLPTLAITLAATGARAQDEAAGALFLPVPQEIPATLAGALSGPEDAAEIASEIRSSIIDPEVASAPAAPFSEDATAAPHALAAPASTAAVESLGPGENAVPATTDAPTNAVISVIVENVETDGGTVNVGLCDKGLSRETCPYDKEVRASAGFVETTFENIPPGSYAVVAYHDANGNGQFDRVLGIPREPYALSGKAAKKMVPTFSDAVLPIHTGENAVVLRLKRLGGG